MSVIVIKLLCTYFTASWITSEGTATELPTGQRGVRIPVGARGLSPIQNVERVPGAHQGFYSMSNVFFPGGKKAGV